MTTKLNILDYGQLVIGIGTLVLAMVLGIATWVKANRNHAKNSKRRVGES